MSPSLSKPRYLVVLPALVYLNCTEGAGMVITHRKMSAKEKILCAVKHEEPDRVPVAPRIWAWFLRYYGDATWKEYLRAAEEFDFDPIFDVGPGLANYIHAGIISDNCRQLTDVTLDQWVDDKGDYAIVRKRFHTPAGTLTDEKKVPKPNRGYGISPNAEITEPLLKSPEDLPKIRFLLPDPNKGDYTFIKWVTREVGDRALVEVRPTIGSDALTIDAMGVENALVNSLTDRRFFEEAFDVFHQYHLAVTRRCLQAGAGAIFDSGFNMSLSVGWSPETWRQVFFPKVKAVCDLVHSYGAIYHFYDDGKFMKILPDMVSTGMDILETCTPPPIGDFDLKTAKERFGEQVCFKGVIDTVTVIAMGTPEQIREEVRKAIEIGAPGGGFILSTSDSIRDETPLENVRAYFKAGREFGGYPIRGNARACT